MAALSSTIDYGPRLNTIIWLLVSLSAIFLFTRLYLKNCQNRGLWWDDYTLLASWLALAGQAGLVAYIIELGYGKDPATIPAENLVLFGPVVNSLSTLLVLSNLWGKTSFALTLLRIPTRWMRFAVLFILISLTATLGMSAVLIWTQCFFNNGSGCIDIEVSLGYNMFSCVYSATMDVLLAFLPWKYIWSLEMSKKERIGVVVAMSMGVLYVHWCPFASVNLLTWGNAESAICIMAASIPILRALVRGHFVAPHPRGYETGDSTAMAESGVGASFNSRTQIFSRSWSPPPRQTNEQRLSASNLKSLDRTLTTGSPDPAGRKSLGDGQDDSSDKDSIELGYYQAQPLSPTDFVRRGMV
ncbi:hypothetical protein B0T26DRAFT_651094 [Lasiosphaeria miniovina]|uniref:Rhodopsin domain-containing protein n=1 Tax=Lasiosphaeria miniovina TaxID=1954250 RepID=A0AA40AE09_9PEZI|nr:uncharacterized protein B0T26DRAFT_651094 [Lasiosphaeria miniovina]KAK0714113.1 hypothetical protein B0T26DRAFT_651094 [Lasiosphaeria miniovina]